MRMNKRTYACDFCDTNEPQEKKLVTVTRQRDGQWYIFEEVPASVCPHCGHRYFDADILLAMEERMKTPPVDARPITAWAISLSQKAG